MDVPSPVVPAKHPTKAIPLIWATMAASFLVAAIARLAKGEEPNWLYIVLVPFALVLAAVTWRQQRNGSQD